MADESRPEHHREWANRPLITISIATRHPEDYLLIDKASGRVWGIEATPGAPMSRMPHPGTWVDVGVAATVEDG